MQFQFVIADLKSELSLLNTCHFHCNFSISSQDWVILAIPKYTGGRKYVRFRDSSLTENSADLKVNCRVKWHLSTL